MRRHSSEPLCRSQISRLNERNEGSDNAAVKNEAFWIRLFLEITNKPAKKKYKTLIFLIMLGHLQKISHFWAQMKKDPKCQLGRFCPEPFNLERAFYLLILHLFYGV